MEGTPAGGAAFVVLAALGALPRAAGRFAATRRGAFFAAFFAGFLPALRFAVFLAVLPAFFGVLVVFLAAVVFFAADFFAVFLAAMYVPPVEVVEMTYMVTYVMCQHKKALDSFVSTKPCGNTRGCTS